MTVLSVLYTAVLCHYGTVRIVLDCAPGCANDSMYFQSYTLQCFFTMALCKKYCTLRLFAPHSINRIKNDSTYKTKLLQCFVTMMIMRVRRTERRAN
jgi:hypothetical protein